MIKANISLYGSIAKYGGGKYVANINLDLENGTTVKDLLHHLQIPFEEKGYLFIDHTLCDAPGLNASLDEPIQEGAHIGIFSTTHMWPYQYRDGVRMSEVHIKRQFNQRGHFITPIMTRNKVISMVTLLFLI